eukprot:Skav217711  [mRNA]  locus=scaffold2294:193872:197854:- [translate_table: standard]
MFHAPQPVQPPSCCQRPGRFASSCRLPGCQIREDQEERNPDKVQDQAWLSGLQSILLKALRLLKDALQQSSFLTPLLCTTDSAGLCTCGPEAGGWLRAVPLRVAVCGTQFVTANFDDKAWGTVGELVLG